MERWNGIVERWNSGMVEWWNSGVVGGASLLNAKLVLLGGYLLTLEGFSTYLKIIRLVAKLRT